MTLGLKNILLLVCGFVLWGFNSFGAEEPYENFIKGAIKKNDSLIVKDEKFKNPLFNWSEITNISVKNTLTLSILNEQEITKNFNLNVTLKVAYFSSPTQQEPTIIDTVKLHVDYDKVSGAIFKATDNYTFTNGYYVKVYVTDIKSPEFGEEIPEIFQLTSTILINRKYKFMPMMPINMNGIMMGGGNQQDGSGLMQRLSGGTIVNSQLRLNWTPLPSGEEYDIEWVTVDKTPSNTNLLDNLISTNPTTVPPDTIAKFFQNNSTRITTVLPDYGISLVYNNDVILARVRQVSYDPTGIRLEGGWNYQYDNLTRYTAWPLPPWHEEKMNWQYSASYAEEGKKKEVITYFDGSLRGRQTVTLNNQDDVAVVQENVYDQYGRVTASILPAPAKDSGTNPQNLHYFQKFNSDATGKQYSFSNLNSSFCETKPDSLNSISGASSYYSGSVSNQFKNDASRLFNKYIPDAAGLPLSVTQYTADNTGRIKLQGGVGPEFQPGNANSRTTKYYYGKPDQWELDRIFGNDVGFADHYLKNMVIDPNGQVSVSYLNASGKTIATALAGPSPGNMQALDSLPAAKTDTVPFINPDKFIFNSTALTLKATTTHLVSAVGPGKLMFSMEQLISRYPGGAFQPHSNCYYDLVVTIKDDCDSYSQVYTDSIGSSVSDSLKTNLYQKAFDVGFSKVGEYYITFELKLNKDVIRKFTNEFIRKGQVNGAVKKESAFILNELSKANFADCLADCKVAREKLGTEPAFRNMFNNKLKQMTDVVVFAADSATYAGFITGLYASLSSSVQSLEAGCSSTATICDQYKTPMLSDLSPGGQYALFDASGNALETSLNVLYKGFKHGIFDNLLSSNPVYQSTLITLEDGKVTSPYDAGFDLADLVKYWQPEWAELFLPLHPEYCKLQFCMANSASENWDEMLKRSDSDAALFVGNQIHYSDTSPDFLLNKDPFFIGSGATHRPKMLLDLQYYSYRVLNINQSGVETKSLNKFVDYLLYCADSTATTGVNPWTSPGSAWYNQKKPECRVIDREWQMYRDMYLDMKQKYFEMLRDSTICSLQCPVGTPVSLAALGSGSNFRMSQSNLGEMGMLYIDEGPEDTKQNDQQLFKEISSKRQQVINDNEFTDSVKNVNETIVTDLSSYYVYSILESDSSSLSTTAVKQSPVSRGNFSKYEFKPQFVAQVASYAFKRMKNVWVSKYIPQIKPDTNKVYVSKQLAGKTTMNLLMDEVPPCTETDFWVSGGTAYQGGRMMYVSYKGDACPSNEVYVHIYARRSGFWISLDYILMHPGEQAKWAQCNGALASDTVLIACGTRPCGNSGPGPDPGSEECTLLSTKKSHFISPNRTPISPEDSPQIRSDLEDQLDSLVKSNCDGNSVIWMGRLSEGLDARGVSQPTRNLLQTKLAEICAYQPDIKYPSGASSILGGTGVMVNGFACYNFGDVIKRALNSPTFTTFTNNLNPWLIDAPGPRGVIPQSVQKIITNTNSSICNNISTLWGSSGTSATDTVGFHNYLKTTFGTAMQLSLSDFKILLKACSNCRFLLAKDIALPQFLDENSNTCITKSDYNAAMSALLAEFGGSLTPDSSNYELIVTNYLNQKWGFSLNYEKYAAFGSSSDTKLCNELPYTDAVLEDFACQKSLIEFAVGTGRSQYEAYIQEERLKFETNYISLSASAQANVNLIRPQQIYHYTLYYYDQAGNLIRTIPPEGVNPLNASATRVVDKARKFNPDGCGYNGPLVNAVKATALQDLSTTLAYNGNAAVELWLYQNDMLSRQMIVTTSDKKYMFQTCIKGRYLNIDVYSLQNDGSTDLKITRSNHITTNIADVDPVLPWIHVVVQGNKLASGALQLWVNGKLYTAYTGPAQPSCSWEIQSVPAISTPENISNLKHLRLYNGRLLTPQEIRDNAESGCFKAFGVYWAWHRFSVPGLGGETTIEGGTLETQYKPIYPAHTLKTTYVYNSLNQVIKQETPDAGFSRFWYDELGRLIISRNAKQALAGKYSFTKYDLLGRISEVGEKAVSNPTLEGGAQQDTPGYLTSSFYLGFLASGTNSQLTQTFYDTKPPADPGVDTTRLQNNLRKRVSASIYRENAASASINASYYDYDLSGNVKTLYQKIAGLEMKKIGYEYDLASGKVNFVSYQDSTNKKDKFFYEYKYDSENRLIEAWSDVQASVVAYGIGSRLQEPTKRLDASYQYYLHGPLARIELGHTTNKVQGIDYAYTLQGWLKGVNGNTLDPATGQVQDGSNGFGKDAVAFSLGYYPGDYQPIVAGSNAYKMQWQPGGDVGNQLYNGNISNSTVAIKGIGGDVPAGYAYRYDQLNRLMKLKQFALNNSTTTWNSSTNAGGYSEDFTYDGNGNILTSKRYSSVGTPFDNLIYKYKSTNGKLEHNKLLSVNDVATSTNIPGELKDLTSYGYDAIGNLTSDSLKVGLAAAVKQSDVEWSVYGKIKAVDMAGTANDILYTYDPAGNRVSKKVGTTSTWYVRDAQGNALAVYDNAGGVINWREQQLYGSSRLGLWKPDINIATTPGSSVWGDANRKNYELTNHLGNVLAVITNETTIAGGVKSPVVVSAQDYYAFGMIQPGRNISSANYRYGFNGKENDNEVKGTGNQQDYGMRIYDPRIGKFLSVDPLSKDYPYYTPYQFAGNSPIKFIDLDGEEPKDPTPANLAKTKTILGIYNGFILGAMLSSNNFGVKHMWQVVHGLNRNWNAFQGVVGEGIAAMNLEGNATYLYGSWAVSHASFNPNQGSIGKATTGNWDVRLGIAAINEHSTIPYWPLDDRPGQLHMASFTPTGGIIEDDFNPTLNIGQTAQILFQVKTLSPNASAKIGILDGFADAINTAKKNPGAYSVLMVDQKAWEFAYKNGGKKEIDKAYKEARNYKVGLYLTPSLTSDSQKARAELYEKVQKGTTNEQK
jgi:RHS repeat-associated protein